MSRLQRASFAPEPGAWHGHLATESSAETVWLVSAGRGLAKISALFECYVCRDTPISVLASYSAPLPSFFTI